MVRVPSSSEAAGIVARASNVLAGGCRRSSWRASAINSTSVFTPLGYHRWGWVLCPVLSAFVTISRLFYTNASPLRQYLGLARTRADPRRWAAPTVATRPQDSLHPGIQPGRPFAERHLEGLHDR